MASSKPPQTTLVFENLPNEANLNLWLMGIDTQFFNINNIFRGIKLIPAGIHLFHYSIPPDNGNIKDNELPSETIISSSSRLGFWFDCKDNDVLILRWDDALERLNIINPHKDEEQLNYTKCLNSIGDIYSYMVSYPEDALKWLNTSISYIDFEVIQEFLPCDNDMYSGDITSMMPSKEENMVLLDALEKVNPQASSSLEDQSDKELRYTIIQFKINKENTESVEEVTENYLDKSWYLSQLYGNDIELMFGELQLSFINFVILGNFCSGLQWLNIIKLILMSKNFMKSSQKVALDFLTIFQHHLDKLPKEYLIDDLALNNLLDLQTYVSVLENFARDMFPKDTWDLNGCCGKMKLSGFIKEKWHRILEINKSKFNIDFEKLDKNRTDENQIEVYDLNDYDENDEDAPAIVG